MPGVNLYEITGLSFAPLNSFLFLFAFPGFDVKKANNYYVQGDRYIFMDNPAPAPKVRKEPAKKKPKVDGQPQVKKEESRIHRILRESNESIKQDKEKSLVYREKFMKRHLNMLEPFLPAHIAARIRMSHPMVGMTRG